MITDRIRPRFVELVPDKLEPGLLYVSLEHGSMVHLCACGCGNEVVLPLTPVDWRLTYDGEDISLSPSVGSWSLACRSHYVISAGRVRWAGDWTEREVEAGRRRDQRRKDERFGTVPLIQEPILTDPPIAIAEPPAVRAELRQGGGIRVWFGRLFGS